MSVIELREYQPPTRRDQLVALSLLMSDVDEPWVVHHVAARLNRLANEVVDASDHQTADILEFPKRKPSAGRFVEAIQDLSSVWWRADARQVPKPTLSVDELFSRVVEDRKKQSEAMRRPDRFEGVRTKALELHAAKRKRPTQKPDMQEFRDMVRDTDLAPDLQRLERDMKVASAKRPWIKEQAKKRAGKAIQLPDEGSIDRVVARIADTRRRSPAARRKRQTAEPHNG